jgi:curved DNA-binding protein CbpA
VVPAGRGRDHDHHLRTTDGPIMTATPNDHYAVLGLRRDASQAEISAAVRNLLRLYHPDTRAPGNSFQDHVSDLTLQQVLTAYQTLRDPARRATYDEQMSPRSRPTSSRAHPIRVSWARRAEDPPLRAGPVRWIPPQ